MLVFEDIKDTLKDGHIVIAKLGRSKGDYIDWQKPKEYTLYVKKYKNEITILAPDESWAEYAPKHDYCNKNLFINEDYYMEVIDWKL